MIEAVLAAMAASAAYAGTAAARAATTSAASPAAASFARLDDRPVLDGAEIGAAVEEVPALLLAPGGGTEAGGLG